MRVLRGALEAVERRASPAAREPEVVATGASHHTSLSMGVSAAMDVAAGEQNESSQGDVAREDRFAAQRWLAAANWQALSLGQLSTLINEAADLEASPDPESLNNGLLASAAVSLPEVQLDGDRPDDPCREVRRARRRRSLEREPATCDSAAAPHVPDPLTYDWELAARLTGRDVGPATAAGAALRRWRDTLLADLAGRLPAVVLVTSATPREGVSQSLLGLALWLAESGSVQPLVVDAAPRRPGIADRLWSGQHIGMGELLVGQAEWHEAIVPLPELGLSLLPAGRAVYAAQRAAPGARLAAFCRRLVERQRLVLVDAGSMTETAAPQWARVADAAYLVVRLGVAREVGTIEALDRLQDCGARVLGAVVTGGPVGSAQQA